ncbi:MAG: acetolactate synthase large subunit [Gammaproteobacteria bacterium]|nr:acetolactate synthase large subunit [Gammaproteobacteria bacterium]
MKAAELFVRCIENEGVEYIFGIPGEENLAVMDALLDSPIKFITTRHEQGAAFMADVYGRLTGKAGVCFSTLGPGATNLVTGVADANMDRAPLVAIAGQASTTRLHKESHQVLDLVNMFQPITKYATQILEPEIIPEVVRKAFKLAQAEKSGACFIEFPENIAALEVAEAPLRRQAATTPEPPAGRVSEAAALISAARNPIILAGNGVVRAGASRELADFAGRLNIGVANTFMAKGVIPFKHPMALGSAGLQARDYVSCGFEEADVIICVGYDLVEYHPYLWHPTRDRKIIHIDMSPAEVDASYIVEVGVVGDIKLSLDRIAALATPHVGHQLRSLRSALKEEMALHSNDSDFPLKPQKIIWDLRTALGLEDIVVCDVGAHKMWMARMFRCEHPNTCIISNGFASMGIAVPGAIAASLARPGRAVVAVTGDAGFLMNSQEIETAIRIKAPIVVLVWTDNAYGLIQWKQMNCFGRESHVRFGNPDFVKYAEAFGAKGYRIEQASELLPTLKRAISDNTVSIIDCPVDYKENLKLAEKLGEMICPL